MATATKTGVKRTIERVKGAVTEVNYAQRRLFELRTGVTAMGQDARVRAGTSAEELESLYDLEQDDELAA